MVALRFIGYSVLCWIMFPVALMVSTLIAWPLGDDAFPVVLALALGLTVLGLFGAWRLEVAFRRRGVMQGAPGAAGVVMTVNADPGLRQIVDLMLAQPDGKWTASQVADECGWPSKYVFEQLTRLNEIGVVYSGALTGGERRWWIKLDVWNDAVVAYWNWREEPVRPT